MASRSQDTALSDGTGTTSFTPDALGRITAVNAPSTGSVEYGYNARGDRTALTYPDGTSIAYSYKADGQLDQVLQGGTALATYSYDTAGRLQQLQRFNGATSGATTTYGYDGADRLNTILTTVGGSTISQFTYTLDRLGLRTQVQETLPGSGSATPSPTPSVTATGPTSTATRTATPSATATGATSTSTATATSGPPTATPTTGSSTLVKAITFEGGSLTDATTGADSVTGTSITLDSSTPLKGAYAAKVPNVGTNYVRENLTAANTLYVSFYLRVDAIPSTSTQIMGFYSSNTRKGNLQLTNAGKLRLRNDSTTIGVDSAALTVGTTYWVGIRQTIGSGTGVLEAFVIAGDAAFSSAFASSSAQTVSGATDNVRVGAIVSDPVAITFDDLTLDTGSMPPPSGSGAPTATPTSAPPTATATATGIPATATRTATPTATATGVPPTATATATGVPPTATATPTASATPVGPSVTPSRTSTPSPTASPTPSATATTAPSATPTSTGGGGLYYAVDPSVGAYLEAETFTAKVGPLFHAFNDATRSNGAGMETTDQNASTASATGATDYLTYDLHVTNGGPVNIYLLSTGPDGDSDSVWLTVDGGTDQQVTTGSTGTWVWKKPSATFSLPTGNHTLTIKNREDGAQVDKIYITTGSTAPTGLGGTALTPQYGSVVSGWLAAYHPSDGSDTVLATSNLDLDGTMSLGRRAGLVADAPQARVQAMPAASLSRTLTYQYDGLLRLSSATESGASTTSYNYLYDLAGNRTSATVNGVTTTRSYNAANQVVGWTYDNAGNLLNDGTTTYGYDALNRQTTTGGTTNSYNGDGVLVQQGTTRYTQDLVAPLSQILGDGTQTYVYGQERLYGQAGTTKTWYGSDALGSVRYTMDAAGTPSAPITYDPWGSVTSGSVPTFGFTGELQQGGLVDLRARWYSTGEGRFGSRDPFGGWAEQPYSMHPYAYAYSNPIRYTDPSGKCLGYLWGDPNCSFAGTDYSHYDYIGAGHVVMTGGGIAATIAACVGTAGAVCAIGAASAAATTSWGNQFLDNAGQPILQAATNVNWRDVALNAAQAGFLGGIGSASVFRQTIGWRSYAAIGALVNGSIGAFTTAFDPNACIGDILMSFLSNAAVGGVFSTTSYFGSSLLGFFMEPFTQNEGLLTYSWTFANLRESATPCMIRRDTAEMEGGADASNRRTSPGG